jgi:hypothetical protein
VSVAILARVLYGVDFVALPDVAADDDAPGTGVDGLADGLAGGVGVAAEGAAGDDDGQS